MRTKRVIRAGTCVGRVIGCVCVWMGARGCVGRVVIGCVCVGVWVCVS